MVNLISICYLAAFESCRFIFVRVGSMFDLHQPNDWFSFPLNDLNSTEPTLSDRWSADRSNWSRNFTKPAWINLAEAYFHLPKMSSGHSGLLHGNQSSTFVQKPHVVLFLKNLHHGKNNMGLFSFYCTNRFKKALLCRNVCTFPTAIQKFFSSFCTLIEPFGFAIEFYWDDIVFNKTQPSWHLSTSGSIVTNQCFFFLKGFWYDAWNIRFVVNTISRLGLWVTIILVIV